MKKQTTTVTYFALLIGSIAYVGIVGTNPVIALGVGWALGVGSVIIGHGFSEDEKPEHKVVD